MPRRKKDPDMPKRPLSSYMFYSKERRPKLQEEKPDLAFGDYSKLIAGEWKLMTPADKEPFLESSKKDKGRYEEQLKAYKEKKRNEPRMPMPVYHADLDHIHMHKNFTTQDNIDAHHQMRKHYRAFQDPNYHMQYMRQAQQNFAYPGKFPPYYMQNPQYSGGYSYRMQPHQHQQYHGNQQQPFYPNQQEYKEGQQQQQQLQPKGPQFPEEMNSQNKNGSPATGAAHAQAQAQAQQRRQFYNQFPGQPPSYQMYPQHQQMQHHQPQQHGQQGYQFSPFPPHLGQHGGNQQQIPNLHERTNLPGQHEEQIAQTPFEDASKLKFDNPQEPKLDVQNSVAQEKHLQRQPPVGNQAVPQGMVPNQNHSLELPQIRKDPQHQQGSNLIGVRGAEEQRGYPVDIETIMKNKDSGLNTVKQKADDVSREAEINGVVFKDSNEVAL